MQQAMRRYRLDSGDFKLMKRIFLSDYKVRPDTGADLLPALKKAIECAGECPDVCEIVFENGVYDIYCDNLTPFDIHISNTHSEEEGKSITRNFAVLLNGCKGVTLNGNGAALRFHGKMSMIGMIGCRDIEIKNFELSAVHPPLTEMTVISEGRGYIDCRVATDSLYRIKNKKVEWYGENFAFSAGVSQLFDPESGITWRSFGPMQDENAVWEEISNGVLRIHYAEEDVTNPYGAKIGYVFQMRDPFRDECGILISDSDNISVKNTLIHFMHCMGFLAQNSSNITADGLSVLPERGRTAAVSADIMHFSGCRGRVSIKNGCFKGSHDDAVNIHGTHLIITERRRANNSVTLRFMHPQTFGIGGFRVNDRIAAVNPDTLLTEGEAEVAEVCELSAREIQLILRGDISHFKEGFAVENISAMPEVEIKNNYFERVPTRGILVTTGKMVRIDNNIFNRIKGCGILIADDAKSWFESGRVCNALIKNNVYRNSGGPFVRVAPENSEYAGAVHKNIAVTENEIFFEKNSNEIFSRINPWKIKQNNIIFEARCTDNIKFVGNRINGEEEECVIHTEKCGFADISDNSFAGRIVSKEFSS